LNWTPFGSVYIYFPDGTKFLFGDTKTDLYIKIKNYKLLWNYLLSGPNAFGDCYVNGDIECSNLTDFFIFYLNNKEQLDKISLFKKIKLNLSYIFHSLKGNSIRGSRQNIRYHYDMGNNFFAEWLDDNMQYSSGHYNKNIQTLEKAQENKFNRINSYLNFTGNEKLLEIGCGWGTLSQYLYNKNQIDIDAITISHEQLKYASALNLKDSKKSCKYLLQDYRKTNGKYNRIISIEMIEAVGEKYLPIYFKTIRNCLEDNGFAIIQGITINDDSYKEYKGRVDFIQKYIFPGGMLPSKSILQLEANNAGLDFEIIEDINLSYVKTLKEWRERFNSKWSIIKDLGYDERFKRIWNYYLCYCEAGFYQKTINISLFRLIPK
tara:strand:- start:11812 stop:12942 length:1131 start_codon:yes stop_codon:yes gene_type:complete